MALSYTKGQKSLPNWKHRSTSARKRKRATAAL